MARADGLFRDFTLLDGASPVRMRWG